MIRVVERVLDFGHNLLLGREPLYFCLPFTPSFPPSTVLRPQASGLRLARCVLHRDQRACASRLCWPE